MTEQNDVGNLVVDLLQAAVRTDGKGQLNVSKVLRASAQSLAQAAAAEKGFPDDAKQLGSDLFALSRRLRQSGIDASITDRVALCAELVARGEQSYSSRFPDPHVCRRCGSMVVVTPTASCERCGAHELTFQRFRPVYWLAEYQPHEVLERLAANPGLFSSALRELAPDRLAWTPPGTAWTATDVLRHVRDAESVLAQRIALILEETEPRLEFKPVFAWTNEKAGATESAESVFKTYVTSRNASVFQLREMGPEDWRRGGLHEEFGRVTLLEQASYFGAHELTHLRQLEQLRRALAMGGGSPGG